MFIAKILDPKVKRSTVVKKITSILICMIVGMLGVYAMSRNTNKNDITLIANPKVLAMQIVDNQVPMIDLNQQNEIAYGPSPEIPNNTDYTQLRKTVYEKLKQAQRLLPKGVHFCLYEGYIPLANHF